ncbi:MAG: glycine betaine ABC transporter substrate-binding protein, partial [Dehalococcoidia bacterium]
YIWSPTRLALNLDLIRLEEPPYNPNCWETDKGCAYPSTNIRKAVHPTFNDAEPEIVKFVRGWKMDNETLGELLEFNAQSGVDVDDTARQYLIDFETIWTQWVPEEVAQRVGDSLSP